MLFAYIIPFILFCLVGALGSLCVHTATLQHCRRPYCAATATSRHCKRPYCAGTANSLSSYQNAERRRLFWACTKCTPSPCILCDPTAFISFLVWQVFNQSICSSQLTTDKFQVSALLKSRLIIKAANLGLFTIINSLLSTFLLLIDNISNMSANMYIILMQKYSFLCDNNN